MTAELLLGIVGVALSLALEYIPGLARWYETLTPDWKRAIIGIALVVATAATLALQCTGLVEVPGLTCDRRGIIDALAALLIALGANQGTHWIARRR